MRVIMVLREKKKYQYTKKKNIKIKWEKEIYMNQQSCFYENKELSWQQSQDQPIFYNKKNFG